MKRWIIGVLAVASFGSMAMAQQNDSALVQKYRNILASGGTQALIQAVSGSVMEAVKEGPSTATPAPAPALAPAAKTWVDSTKIYGDMRFREELRDDHAKDPAHQPGDAIDYDRFRARLGIETKPNDDVIVGMRLATDGYGGDKTGVGGDPQSNNQDMNNGASKKPIFLDAAYIDWNLFGANDSELHAIFGKMNNPFITMNDDTIWDPDNTPEGVALKGNLDLRPVTLLLNAGYLVVNNQDSASAKHDQTDLYVVQGAVKYELCPEATLTLGVSDYYFYDIKNTSVSLVDIMSKATSTKTFYGNDVHVTGTSTNFTDGFDVIEPFAALDLFPKVCDHIVPVSIYAQAVKNVLTDHLNHGEMFGVTLGKAKLPQTFEIGTSYCRLQRDSTLGMWTDSDRWGGGTDGEGYKVYAKYIILKNLAAQITYYNDRKGIDTEDRGTIYDRWAFDLVASF